jgi:hypothetical protein
MVGGGVKGNNVTGIMTNGLGTEISESLGSFELRRSRKRRDFDIDRHCSLLIIKITTFNKLPLLIFEYTSPASSVRKCSSREILLPPATATQRACRVWVNSTNAFTNLLLDIHNMSTLGSVVVIIPGRFTVGLVVVKRIA